MPKEKTFNASKQEDKLKDKFADELLSDDELDNVAGGIGGDPWHPDDESPDDKPPVHCH